MYFSDSDLRYASNATGAWVSAPVAIGLLGGIGSPLALTVDADKHAHVAYLDSSTNALRYATNAGNGTDWVVEKIADAAPGANIVSSITTDAGTRLPTVDFFDLPSGVLSRATRDAGGNWDTNARHTVTDVASDAAIATDAAGKVHLAYID